MTSSLEREALEFARLSHKNYLYGDRPYIEHLMTVHSLLKIVTPTDIPLLAAGFLHDTLEDTPLSHEELVHLFGDDVATLVWEVTKDPQSQEKIFPHLSSQRGIILKFADRLANISHMEGWSLERKVRYLQSSTFWKSTATSKKDRQEEERVWTLDGQRSDY